LAWARWIQPGRTAQSLRCRVWDAPESIDPAEAFPLSTERSIWTGHQEYKSMRKVGEVIVMICHGEVSIDVQSF
jgi:hypothetical protein